MTLASRPKKGPALNPELLAKLRSEAKETPAVHPRELTHSLHQPATAEEDETATSSSSALSVEEAQTRVDRADPSASNDHPLPQESELHQENGLTIKEIVARSAVDSDFFARTFFPKTARQEGAPFHREMDELLDDPSARYVNIQAFRGSAKTTKLRIYMCKRIAYGLSRTIVYVGASEDKAKTSLEWVKNQVSFNALYRKVFGLAPLKKHWQATDIRISHGPMQFNVAIQVFGITGSIRGTNIDDWRPDLIVIDDVIGDDNSATIEQRVKIKRLILGAVKESLAPRSETPDAKMVIINTPQDFEDLSQSALRDPQFKSARFGCWTKETEDLPIEFQESAWPARWTSEELRKEKASAIARNEYSTFAREMECKLVTLETSAFRAEWLRYFGEGEAEPEPPRDEVWVEYVIDPVPPPSDIQIAKGLINKDYEAHTVVGRYKGKYYVLETVYNRGHDPDWTAVTFNELCNRWAPRKVLVESVAYQRTLTWLLRQAMKRTGRYYAIEPFDDKRKKYFVITQGLRGVLANGALYFRRSQGTAISQVIHYPGQNPEGTFDDVIETIARGVMSLERGHPGEVKEGSAEGYLFSEKEIPALADWRGAP